MTALFERVFYYFQVGGWTMGAILACSVLGLAVSLERLWTLRWPVVVPKGLPVEVEDLIGRGKIPEAVTLCKKDGSPLAAVIRAGVDCTGKSREQIKEIINEVGRVETASLEKGLTILHTIIVLSPMLGFLGTVLGMVDLFSSIASAGEVANIGVVADGVYKALYTTVFGLTVAIPITIFYKMISSKVDRLVLAMEEISLRIVDLVQEKK